MTTTATNDRRAPTTTLVETPFDAWFTLCRQGKDATIAWMNESFDLWERECRVLFGGFRVPTTMPADRPMDLWTESWKRWMDFVASAGRPGSAK